MTESEVSSFHWVDYVVFTLTLVLAIGIGIYYAFTGGKQKTTKEYLMGNRQLLVFPVGMSMFMSTISAILILGETAEMYQFGTQHWLACVGNAIAYPISAYLFVTMLHPLKLTSAFEYHTYRFDSKPLRLFCVLAAMVQMILYMGLALYSPSTALEAVTGFPVWASLICTGVVATVYTTIGGMKAVVWTDFFQGFVMLGGLIIVLIMGCIEVGGLTRVWNVSEDAGRIIFFNMNPDPTVRMTFWTAVVGAGSTTLAVAGFKQTVVQRYSSLPTVKDAVCSMLLQIPLDIIAYTLVCLCGLVVFAYYDTLGCDPLRAGVIDNSNQLIPYFMVDALNYPGLPGLFVAVLFSGALSSISSSLNSLAALTWKDFLEDVMRDLKEAHKALLNKILVFAGQLSLAVFVVFVYGTFGVIMGYAMQYLTGHVMQIANAILGGLTGPLAGVVLAGALLPCVEWKGALVGVAFGVFMTSWINIGALITAPHRETLPTNVDNCTLAPNTTVAPIQSDPEGVYWLYTISYMYMGMIGMVTALIASGLYSFSFGALDPETVNSTVTFDCGTKCFCCCSPSVQECMQCRVDYSERERLLEDIDTLAVVEDQTKPDNYLDGMAKVIDEPKRTFNSRDDIQPPDYMDVAETETSTTEF